MLGSSSVSFCVLFCQLEFLECDAPNPSFCVADPSRFPWRSRAVTAIPIRSRFMSTCDGVWGGASRPLSAVTRLSHNLE